MSWIDHSGAMFSRYSGGSMWPVFHHGDYVKFVPCRAEEICVGDVIVFLSITDKQRIMHRVVSLKGGIRTRGDNNPGPDDAPVPPESICGKVISVQKKNRVVPVQGGAGDYLRALPRWIGKDLVGWFSRLLHPLYHALADTGIFRKLFSPWVKYQHHHPGDSRKKPKILARLGGRIIAVYLLGEKFPRIRRPFRLIIDEEKLMGEFSKKR